MKKVLFAMVLAMAVAASAQALSVALVPSSFTVTPSTIFTIDVVISDAMAPGVEVLDVLVLFNPALVEAVGASEGSFISAQGGPVMEFLEVVPGSLSYTVTRLGPESSTGSGTAATLTFHCLAPGITQLAYLVQATDVSGDIILAQDGYVLVQQGIVPEPMTLALIGAALTALGFVARKRS